RGLAALCASVVRLWRDDSTLAPRKVFFRRTRRRKNDFIFFRRLRAAYPQGAGCIRMAAQLPTAARKLCEAILPIQQQAEPGDDVAPRLKADAEALRQLRHQDPVALHAG